MLVGITYRKGYIHQAHTRHPTIHEKKNEVGDLWNQ